MHPETDFPPDLRVLENDYALIRELGRGGMAAVYLARRRDTGRLVAIKAVRARYLDDPDALRRFAREARTVAGLSHPNIVRTEAIEQIGDRAVAIIMEYIDGGTVRDRLREYGAFSAEDAESVLRDLANALGYAHRQGIVHRDVKPENVFLEAGTRRALLSDFGIARRIEGDAPITLLGAALGTPQYMSPEQIDGGRIDGRSDIYSLGVLGWELLNGRRPWAGENLYSIIYKQKHEELPRITTLRPRVPANLLVAIERALEKSPARRWQSADELLEHLTYNAPPVLAQSYPGAAASRDDEETIRFRRDVALPGVASAGAAAAPSVGGAEAARPLSSAPALGGAAPDPSGSSAQRHVTEARRDHESRRLRESAPRSASVPAPRAASGRRAIRVAALLLPLTIAVASLFVVFDPSGGARGSSSGTQTSGGIVALDTARTPDTVTRASTPDTATASDRAAPPASRRREDGDERPVPETKTPPSRRPADTLRRTAAAAPNAAPASAVRLDSVGRDSSPSLVPIAEAPAGPSPRCQRASTADQRACLLAHIARNDAVLQGVYDSLIVELRRAARVPRGAPDPPPVTRLRVEQRAWIAIRDQECTRHPAIDSMPFWAQPLSVCFAEMSAARADELREALGRMRR